MNKYILLIAVAIFQSSQSFATGAFCEIAYSIDRVSLPSIYKNQASIPPYSYATFDEAIGAFQGLVNSGECEPNPLACHFYFNPTGSSCTGFQGFQRSYRVTGCVSSVDEIFAAAAKLFKAKACGEIVFHSYP